MQPTEIITAEYSGSYLQPMSNQQCKTCSRTNSFTGHLVAINISFFLNKDCFFVGQTTYYSPTGSAKDVSHMIDFCLSRICQRKNKHKLYICYADTKPWQIGHQECNNIHILIVLFYSGLLHRLYCNGMLLALQCVFFLFLPCDLNILKK